MDCVPLLCMDYACARDTDSWSSAEPPRSLQLVLGFWLFDHGNKSASAGTHPKHPDAKYYVCTATEFLVKRLLKSTQLADCLQSLCRDIPPYWTSA